MGGWEEGVQEVKGVGGCVQEAGGRGAGGEGGGRGGGASQRTGFIAHGRLSMDPVEASASATHA